ncbi:MAG TPA: LLM class F420-dependent oxidoreductase [Acidimicrobiales bacterium]
MKFCQSLMYAAPEQWIELTRVAEAAGFDQVSLSDHVFYPDKLDSSYPYSATGQPIFPPETQWPDVWVMTGALAAVTERITFSTHVYVLPARNPFVVAKAVGTAAHLSGGRVLLGVGAGWMREEFTQLEQPFERRGARMEEQIEVLRTLWRGGMVEHHGTFYDFDRLEMSPAPARPVPILIGGHSETALRRAARIGDGWMGVYYGIDELAGIVERLQGYRREYGTVDRPFEIQASIVDRVPTPEVCAELAEAGVTCIVTSAWMMAGLQFASLDENIRALERFGEQYIAPRTPST